jgi:MFS family permease
MHSSSVSILYPMAAGEFDAISGGNEAMSLYSLASSLTGPVSIILMPLWGYLAARNPHLKVPLLSGSVIIGAVTICVRAFATNIYLLIACGALYGFVSAGVFVIGFMLIRDMFPAEKVGVYMGLTGTMMAIGSLGGPVISGFVAGMLGWRIATHILWVPLLLGAILVLLGVKISKEQGEAFAYKSGNIDVVGIFAVALFLAPLICGISMGRSFLPFGSVQNFVVFGVALIALIVLIINIKNKGAAAVIPLPALKDRNTVMLALSNFLMNFANMFVFFFLPTYIITVIAPEEMGLAPSAWSGLIMAAFAVAGLFLGPIFGKMIGKSGNARNVLVLGIIARLAFLLFLVFFLTAQTSVFVLLVLALVLGGIYSVMATAHTTGVSVMAPPELRQQSNAVVQMGQNLGGAPGTAIGGILIATFGVANGLPVAFIVASIAVAAMFIPTLLLKKRKDEDKQ